MNYYNLCSLEENVPFSITANYNYNKSLMNLDLITKKMFDYEKNSFNYDDINRMFDLFQKIPHYEYRSPIYFVLGYVSVYATYWNTVWSWMDWFAKWFGNDLDCQSVVRYHRYIVQHLLKKTKFL